MSAPVRKESILDLKLLVEKRIHVKLAGGREVEGKLKGFDQLLNLVLDDCTEFLQDPNDPNVITDQQRQLGLIVARGTAVTVINPCDVSKRTTIPSWKVKVQRNASAQHPHSAARSPVGILYKGP